MSHQSEQIPSLAYSNFINTCRNAEALRDNEYAADETAVKLITGDLNSAISCLQKLCQNNLDISSHLWEYFDIDMPIMTFRERMLN